ncbi:hypothetical protein NEOKW01_0197 [Nematocida sp. AWRm80]|nr:hypothetical protein NEOKW01_0197 [Nematocida sp. AWRm80]
MLRYIKDKPTSIYIIYIVLCMVRLRTGSDPIEQKEEFDSGLENNHFILGWQTAMYSLLAVEEQEQKDSAGALVQEQYSINSSQEIPNTKNQSDNKYINLITSSSNIETYTSNSTNINNEYVSSIEHPEIDINQDNPSASSYNQYNTVNLAPSPNKNSYIYLAPTSNKDTANNQNLNDSRLCSCRLEKIPKRSNKADHRSNRHRPYKNPISGAVIPTEPIDDTYYANNMSDLSILHNNNQNIF